MTCLRLVQDALKLARSGHRQARFGYPVERSTLRTAIVVGWPRPVSTGLGYDLLRLVFERQLGAEQFGVIAQRGIPSGARLGFCMTTTTPRIANRPGLGHRIDCRDCGTHIAEEGEQASIDRLTLGELPEDIGPQGEKTVAQRWMIALILHRDRASW